MATVILVLLVEGGFLSGWFQTAVPMVFMDGLDRF